MPCHTRMKIICLQGLLWFYFLEFGLMVTSLEPGFLDFDNLPDTNFSCVGKVVGGYYADLETNCQMFHVCTIGQSEEPMDIRFLCLNGTVFDQETRVCERIDEVDCSKSEKFYSLNLELYGNTQPPLLEETPETEQVFTLKKPTTTSTTTTTTMKPSTAQNSKSTQRNYYNHHTQTTAHTVTKEIPSVLGESSDIRFNPLEINVNLKHQSPPIIKNQIPKPISFHHQSFVNDNPRTKITTVSSVNYNSNNKPHRVPLLPAVVTHQPDTSPKSDIGHQMMNSHSGPSAQEIFDFINRHQNSQGSSPTEVNFGFTFYDPPPIRRTTENYHIHQPHVDGLRPPPLIEEGESYVHSKQRNHFGNNEYPSQTTISSIEKVTPSKRPTFNLNPFHEDKSHGIHLPLPALPHLNPLSFSSPAPFSLNPRIENKRFTSNSNSPRIVISARASVSDNSGRRLNYSLGTIGETELVGVHLPNYDEYKDDLDSLTYYEDVEKTDKKKRSKRSVEEDIDDLIKNDNGGIDVLKYLYDWYSKQEETTTVPSLIAEINYKLAPLEQELAETRGDINPNLSMKRYPSKLRKGTKETETSTNYPGESNFGYDNSEEEFGGFEGKHFDFMKDSDHDFFDKDVQDSFEMFEDTQDFPIGDMEKKDAEKDDKKGRKYSYKKIILSQASNDGDKEKPNRKSVIKNNKVISHEAFSEFTNFTDYDDNDEPKIKLEPLTTETLPVTKPTTTYETQKPITKKPVFVTSTTPITTTYKSKTKSRGVSRHRSARPSQNRYPVTTTNSYQPERIRNSRRRTNSYLKTTLPPTTTPQTTTQKYLYDYYDYDSDETYTLAPSTTMRTVYETTKNLEEITDLRRTTVPYSTTIREQVKESTTFPSFSHQVITTPLEVTPTTLDETSEATSGEETDANTSYYSNEEYTEDSSEDMEYETTSAIPKISTLRSSLPLEQIFSYFVSPPPITKETPKMSEIGNSTTTEPAEQKAQNETIKSLIQEIELRTKSIVNEKDIENLNATENLDTLTYSTLTEPILSNNSTIIGNKNSGKIFSRHRFSLNHKRMNITETPIINRANQSEAENSSSTVSVDIQTTNDHSSSDFSSYTTPMPISVTYDTESTKEVISTTETIDVFNTTETITTTEDDYTTINPYRQRNINRNGKKSRTTLKPNVEKTTKYSRKPKPNLQNTKVDIVASFSESNTTQRSRTVKNENKNSKHRTEQPLSKNVSPTRIKDNSEVVHSTTPYSRRGTTVTANKAFSCSKKDLNKFYYDPRDCRLFHYCTPGYGKGHIVDMKFVCDLGTYFDDEKLVCSKTKPSRCL